MSAWNKKWCLSGVYGLAGILLASPLMAQFGFPGQGGGGGGFPGQGGGFQGQGGGLRGGGIGGGIGGSGLGGGGQQGGIGRGGFSSIVPPGGSTLIAANCTDLFLATPTSSDRYTIATDGGQVQLASGEVLPLQQAFEAGVLVLRGAEPRRSVLSGTNPFYTIRFALANPGKSPVRVQVPSAARIVPAGQSGDASEALHRVVAEGVKSRLEGTPALACAVWAARGSTREDVEQTMMGIVPAKEITRTQDLLNRAEVKQVFDRDAGAYEKLFDHAAGRIKDGEEFAGRATLPDRTQVEVEGVRGADGKGVVAVMPVKTDATFFYNATFQAKQGKVQITLTHLKSGRQLEVHGGVINVTPATARTASVRRGVSL